MTPTKVENLGEQFKTDGAQKSFLCKLTTGTDKFHYCKANTG
jgi:hypothetical protein